jgi:4-amino-4-deoxy-L-arabinose transferase-like glycosyltransferase
MVETIDRRKQGFPDWLKLLLWSAVMALFFVGMRPLWLPDDGRYAEVAREMVVTGDWITPQLDFTPHYSKPPLTYWISAGAMKLFGKNEFAVRLAVALPFVACVLLTFLLAAEFRDRQTGFIAGLVLMTSPIPFVAANIITPDMLLTCCELGAIYFIWRWHRRDQKSIGSLLIAYLFLGLAFLTKGPVGLLIPFLAFFGYAAYSRDWRILRAFASLRGWILCLFIGLTWYVVLVIRHPELWDYFLGHELADRMFTTIHHRNNSFVIYPAVLLGGLLPWTIHFVRGWIKALPWKKFRERKIELHHAFLLSWILLPLVFFSIVRSRLPLYVLPLFVPMAILAGDFLANLSGKPNGRRKAVWIAVVMSVVLMGLQVGASYYPSRQNLYPIVQRMRTAKLENPVLYSNRNDLYPLNFYMGKRIESTDDYQRFLDDSLPAFYVLDRSGTAENLPEQFRHLPVLIHYYDFWLFSNRPVHSGTDM